MDRFKLVNPTDFRYLPQSEEDTKAISEFLSESAMVRYMAQAEAALTATLANHGICSKAIAAEVEKAAAAVTAEEVYEEEARIKHNVRALANSIRKRVGTPARPFVHLSATSHDIICTAEAARLRDAGLKLIVPALKELEKLLIAIATREKGTLQIGRTHGQHAEPITFGFALAEYVSRLGTRIQAIEAASRNLRGKLSGAVGAYNAGTLLLKDPEKAERDFLEKMGLSPATHSTQIVEPEFAADYMHAIVSAFGVLASLADDMRHLQRSEIAEVGEAFGDKQVGSSTMPHKRNPVNFENVKSLWKAFMPRMVTVYLDQPSEHQRDLTNSASSRYNAESVAILYLAARRLMKTLSKMVVDKAALKRNFEMSAAMVAAEPLYVLLAFHGHPDAHEKVRELTLKAGKSGRSVLEVAQKDSSLSSYFAKFSRQQLSILRDATKYSGLAVKKTEEVCAFWEKELKLR